MTADALAGVDVELLACGFDAAEPKPIMPATLLAALTGALTAAPCAAQPVSSVAHG